MTKTLISLLFVFFFQLTYMSAQNYPSYDMKFLRAKITDTTDKKDIIVLFLVTTKEEKDWAPVLSMKVTYTVYIDEPGETKTYNIGKRENGISITINGNNIKENGKYIYNLIKDKIDTTYKKEFWILEFNFRNVSTYMVKKMEMTYGLWEKNNQDIRIEKKYEFEVEH